MSPPAALTVHRPALVYRQAEDAADARALASSLGTACLDPDEPPPDDIALELHGGVLSILDNREPGHRPLCADFESRESASKKQPLGQAVGRGTHTVLDATAGWGSDARRLAAMGYIVTAVERHPIMAALLENAAARAYRAGIRNVPRVVAADAVQWLAARPGVWDCVYLDPMFPPKRRSSTLAKRPLRLLRELAGDDDDRLALFRAACAAAPKRVVVKRPDHGRPAFEKPTEVVVGKLVHYDVYHLQ